MRLACGTAGEDQAERHPDRGGVGALAGQDEGQEGQEAGPRRAVEHAIADKAAKPRRRIAGGSGIEGPALASGRPGSDICLSARAASSSAAAATPSTATISVPWAQP